MKKEDFVKELIKNSFYFSGYHLLLNKVRILIIVTYLIGRDKRNSEYYYSEWVDNNNKDFIQKKITTVCGKFVKGFIKYLKDEGIRYEDIEFTKNEKFYRKSGYKKLKYNIWQM